ATFLIDQKRDVEAKPFLERASADDAAIAPWMWLRIGDVQSLNRILQGSPRSAAAIPARIRLAALDPSTFEETKSIRIDELTEREFVDAAQILSQTGHEDLAITIRMRLL